MIEWDPKPGPLDDVPGQTDPFPEDDKLRLEAEDEEDEFLVEYDITTYPSDFTLNGIHELWQAGDIQIPEFQRHFVWSLKQSSLLIESFLIGLPVPPVFLYVDEENKNLVIDCQQRILSIVYYFSGYFGPETPQGRRQVFRLKGLDPRSSYADKTFAELDEKTQRKLKSSVLRAMHIRQHGPAGGNTSAYHIFERLNTGGTPLSPQEIRNCVFRGEIVTVLRELNRDPNWRLLIGKPTPDKDQKDIELLLRVFAMWAAWGSYERPMKEFLNRVMKDHRKGSRELDTFKTVFPRAAEFAVLSLGAKPFHLRGPLNASLLDTVMATVIGNMETVDNLARNYQRLIQNTAFLKAVSASSADAAGLRERMTLARKTLVRTGMFI